MSPTLIHDRVGRSRQAVFPRGSFDPPPVPAEDLSGFRDRMFFGLHPPPAIAARIHRLAGDLRDGHALHCRLVRASCLHVTLLGMGYREEWSRTAIAALGTAAARVAMPPFRVAFDRAASFNGEPERPLVLVGDDGVIGIEMLRQELVRALRNAGFARREEARFTPHLTLLYDRRKLEEQPIDEIGWSVRDFVLIHSLYGLSRHVPLGRWPLRG